MEEFPWWTKEQKEFAKEVKAFVDDVISREEEERWKREFPWDIFQSIGERGFTGAGIPKEYGGLGLGATGACIAVDQLSRMPLIGIVFVSNMLGGLHQILRFGTTRQKEEYLPKIARGEMGAVCITEPFAGTDAASIVTTARLDHDKYLLNGKKRFITSAGTAKRYLVYAKTSDSYKDIASHQHLTAFIVEKGTPGFSVEKINEIGGFDNIQNGVLDLDEVSVPISNRLGQEGEGWKILTSGLNFERTVISAQAIPVMLEMIKNVVNYAERRIQFNKPIANLTNNQFKIADMIMWLTIARLTTYYCAYMWDLGRDVTIGSNVAKVFNCEQLMEASIDAIQLMGGDGLTSFYPLESLMRLSKINEIAGGSLEACRLVIYKTGLSHLMDDLKNFRRQIHKELGVPVYTTTELKEKPDLNETRVLEILAEDYKVNPGLYMTINDLKEIFIVGYEDLITILISLEQKGLVVPHRKNNAIEMVKASYEGLRKAYPIDYYKWFPNWVKKENIF